MFIGLVYDLREYYLKLGYSMEDTAEFDPQETVDAIKGSLERLGHEVDLVGNGIQLATRLCRGDKWDIVFPISEGLTGRNREAQVPALLEMFGQKYMFSDALTMSVTLDKSIAKRIVRDCGVVTAAFQTFQSPDTNCDGWNSYPAFIKPIAEGTSKGCDLSSRVYNSRALTVRARELIGQFKQPVIVEEFLPGREFTAAVVGNGADAKVLGVAEITMLEGADPDVFSLKNKENQDSLCKFTLVTDDEALLVARASLVAYHALGCLDCCRIDFRSNSHGIPHFLEANPLAGLHPANSDLPVLAALCGIDYDEMINGLLMGALSRYR